MLLFDTDDMGVPRICTDLRAFGPRIVIFLRTKSQYDDFAIAGVGLLFVSWKPLPDEVYGLAAAVVDLGIQGPWRQLVDYLIAHVEDMPEDFRIAFEVFLAAAFPENSP